MRPPLTNGLVTELQFLSTECRAVLELVDIAMKRADPAPNFEEALREVYEMQKDNPVLGQQFVQLRRAISELISHADDIGKGGATLYDRLLAYLRTAVDQILVVNMNYDRLAEYAISPAKGFSTFDDYLEFDPQVKLYHPHGSCAWAQTTDALSAYNSVTTAFGSGTRRMKFGRGGTDVPALALPMSGDPDGKWAIPNSHMHDLKADLAQVDSLIVVGWRGADEHLVSFLREGLFPDGKNSRLSNVHLVAHGDGADTESNLSSICDRREVKIVDGGFAAYLENESPLYTDYRQRS